MFRRYFICFVGISYVLHFMGVNLPITSCMGVTVKGITLAINTFVGVTLVINTFMGVTPAGN